MEKIITEAQVLLTRRCNLDCSYCKLTRKKMNELSPNQWKRSFLNMESIGIRTVKILGGEPTIFEGIEELIRFINDNTGLRFALLSNSVMSDEKLNRLAEAGIQGYFASVDKITDIKKNNTHSGVKSRCGFEKLLKLRDMGVRILGANIVITKENLHDLPEMISELTENGIWSNLCPVISGNEDFWEFRSDSSDNGIRLTDEDRDDIDIVMKKLVDMKRDGLKIAVPESYLLNMSGHGVDNDWKCTEMLQLRIDSDGGMMLCNDYRGNIAEKYNIVDMNPELYLQFRKEWNEERRVFDCPGCYWSCFLNAEYNLNRGINEFDYVDGGIK